MSTGFQDSGEVERVREQLFGMDPRIAEFLLGLSDIYSKLDSGERLGGFTDDQLAVMQAGLDGFSGVIQAEQQHRQQTQRLTELSGSERPAPARIAAVVELTTRDAAPAMVDKTESEIEPQTAPEPVTDSEPMLPDSAILVIDRPNRAHKEPQHITINGITVGVYSAHTADVLRILANDVGKVMKRDDFLKKGFGSSLSPEGSSRGQAFGRVFKELDRQPGLLDRLAITPIGEGASRRYVYRPHDNEDIPLSVTGAESDAETESAAEEVLLYQAEGETVEAESEPEAGESVDKHGGSRPMTIVAEIAAAEVVEVTSVEEMPESESTSDVEPEPLLAQAESSADGRVIPISSKGLDVAVLDDGKLEIRLGGQKVDGLERFGDKLPGYVLLSIALNAYSSKIHLDEITRKVEHLGADAEMDSVGLTLRTIAQKTVLNGEVLLRDEGSNIWTLKYEVGRTGMECLSLLKELGLGEEEARRFLA